MPQRGERGAAPARPPCPPSGAGARAPGACSGARRGRARRDALTGVVVQDLAGGGRAALACAALVRKVAVYAGRLAVLLPGDLLVYAALPGGRPRSPDPGADRAASAARPGDGRRPGARVGTGTAAGRACDVAAGGALRYTLAARIAGRLECNLLVATDRHLVLCQARRGRAARRPARPLRAHFGNRRVHAQRHRGHHTGRRPACALCRRGLARGWAGPGCAALRCARETARRTGLLAGARPPCPPGRQQQQTADM